MQGEGSGMQVYENNAERSAGGVHVPDEGFEAFRPASVDQLDSAAAGLTLEGLELIVEKRIGRSDTRPKETGI